jgi:phosphatidate cytidylyltransferase
MPSISPKKSWEGFVGGLAASLLVAWLLVGVWGDRFTYGGVPVLGRGSALFWGFFCAVLGLWGDVAESALKRAAQAKNSGIVPGFGGVLDLLDSLVLVAPFFYAYVVLAAGRG